MIKNLTKGRIHKTSLFIQPDYKCNLECKGCYALKSENYGSIEFINKLVEIDRLTNDNMAEFNQITISFNDLDEGDAVCSYQTCKPFIEKAGKEKIHYACSINSLETYADIIDFNECSVLNLSFDKVKWNKLNHETQTDAIRCIRSIRSDYPDLHINANCLLELCESLRTPNNLVLSCIEKDIDSIHLIMNKPVKDLFNEDYIQKFKDVFEDYIKATIIYKIKFGSKINIDACVKTALKNLINSTTYTCRAGIDHISIWPEGKMTGCPYRMPALNLNGKAGSILSFLDYNDVSNVKISEFSHCLYDKLAVSYGTFEGLCDELNLKPDEKAAKILKSLI